MGVVQIEQRFKDSSAQYSFLPVCVGFEATHCISSLFFEEALNVNMVCSAYSVNDEASEKNKTALVSV